MAFLSLFCVDVCFSRQPIMDGSLVKWEMNVLFPTLGAPMTAMYVAFGSTAWSSSDPCVAAMVDFETELWWEGQTRVGEEWKGRRYGGSYMIIR